MKPPGLKLLATVQSEQNPRLTELWSLVDFVAGVEVEVKSGEGDGGGGGIGEGGGGGGEGLGEGGNGEV